MEEKKYLDIIGLGIFKLLIDKRYPILDPSQKIPQSYLPSYVDDVVEYTSKDNFPATGESGKIYVDTTTNLTYRWGGSSYVEISPSLALGETSSTAFRGDLGKTAYEHSQATHKITIVGLGISTLNGSITADQMKTPLGITALEGYFTNGIAKEAAKVSNALTINGTAYDGSSAVTITTPNDDTKNTTGSTQDTNKLFIIGAKTQAANPQTYSNSACYISGNELYSNSKAVLTSITKAMVESVLTGNITSHTHTFASLTSKPTTIAGYGITDAKIANGVITLGVNTITPLTAHQTIYKLTIQKNGVEVGTYTPNSQAATINISDVASAATLSAHTTNTTVHITANERTLWNKITGLFDVDTDGDVYVKNGKGFYTEGFISAGAKGTSGGSGSTYTQKEWAQIKEMTATAAGSLASAYAVKEAYSEAKTLIDVNTGNITSLTSRVTTLEGKATAVSFLQTLTSGTKIGAITVDGTTTNIYAPTLASQMGSTAIGGTSSYLYWNGSAWATKSLGSNAFTSISKVSQLTNDSGYISGITKSMVEGVLTGNITSHTHSYLPLSGGTLTGSVTMQGMNTNLIRNITYTGTTSWARSLIDLQVDGVHKFGISAFGDYTAGASNNGIQYGFIGCNSYDGLNLRISATSLSWGDNSILHSGNYNSYAPSLTGTGATGTWGISISGDAKRAKGFASVKRSSSIDLNTILTNGGVVGNYNNTADWANQPSGMNYGSVVQIISNTEFNNTLALQLAWDINHNSTSSTKGLWFRASNNLGWQNDWKTIYHSGNLTASVISSLGTLSNSISGNAATATKLATSRTLWGQSFDGTGNVSGNLTDVGSITPTTDTSYNIGTSSNQFKWVYANGVYAKSGSWLGLGANNADHIRIITNGNVGIGTTSPSYKLHIVGVAYASEGLVSDGYISAASTSTSSDIRLKDNISEISSEKALKMLSMLKPKSWTWNSLAGVKGRSMGFVAQDIEGILPQMIRKRRDNGYLSLDYTQLHALEVSAIQSHENEIERLKDRVSELEAEINRLKQYAN